jgi:prophage antirepressor-like protein
MYEVTIFNNSDFGEVRTLETNGGKVLFCGIDVAAALGYAKPNNAITAHCKYALKQGVPHPQSPDKTIEMTFIPESDIYRLAFGSKLPTAEKFTDWVTDEVLPAIRKTGSYKIKNADPLKEKRLEIMEMNAKAKQAKVMLEFAKLGLSSESKELLASNAVEIMTGKRLLPLPTTEKTYSAGEVGKMLGISANKVGRIANANNLKTDEYGITVLDAAKNGKQIPTFRYNDAGIERLKNIIG